MTPRKGRDPNYRRSTRQTHCCCSGRIVVDRRGWYLRWMHCEYVCAALHPRTADAAAAAAVAVAAALACCRPAATRSASAVVPPCRSAVEEGEHSQAPCPRHSREEKGRSEGEREGGREKDGRWGGSDEEHCVRGLRLR
jgi:hypothetical protein